MPCPPFFIPFIAVLLLLPSLSFSRILPCSLPQILLLPWIPLPLKCHICLWLLTGTSTFILLPVLKTREDISQGCIATFLRSKSCMQFRFFFFFPSHGTDPTHEFSEEASSSSCAEFGVVRQHHIISHSCPEAC